MMKLKAIWFAVLSITVFFPGMPSRAENPIKASPDRFSIAVECVKRFEGWHGEKKHWPYVGWGHKVLPGERFTNSITKAQGDSILRADLRKLCRMFSYLGRDSLIVSVLAGLAERKSSSPDGCGIFFRQTLRVRSRDSLAGEK